MDGNVVSVNSFLSALEEMPLISDPVTHTENCCCAACGVCIGFILLKCGCCGEFGG